MSNLIELFTPSEKIRSFIPILFIFSVEVLSSAMNALFDDAQYVGSRQPKWISNINHLAYENKTMQTNTL